jgi:hypothetical protein
MNMTVNGLKIELEDITTSAQTFGPRRFSPAVFLLLTNKNMNVSVPESMVEFNRRAALARGVPSLESFTASAMDWLRVAAFAGFDVPDLVRRIVAKNSRSTRFNAASVQNMMQAVSNFEQNSSSNV